jgi:dUTPase
MGEFDFKITHGMRIAQIIFAETLKVQFKVSKNLSQTMRSNRGFGSTGTK